MIENRVWILIRLWSIGVGCAIGIAAGLAVSGISLLPCLLWGIIGLSLSPMLVFVYQRNRRLRASDETVHGLHDVTYYYSLVAITVAGLWMGVAAGNIYQLLRYHSSTESGHWVSLVAPIVMFGSQGLGALKRPQSGEQGKMNRTMAWLSLGLASVMAVMVAGIVVAKLLGAQ